MKVRNLSPVTQRCYVHAVAKFAQYFNRSPDWLGLADVRIYQIHLASQKSARTRRAYRLDVQHFMRTLGITMPEELRQADHKAVIAWERYMRETEHAASSTIRRRLAALSSLYKHLVRHDHAARNPVGEVERPAINRDEGSTLAFAKAQARNARRQRLDLVDPLGRDHPEFCGIAADRVGQLGAVADQPVTHAGQHQRRLALRRLHRHEPHGRPAHRFTQCFGIGRIEKSASTGPCQCG
jgi:hypothetical protein